MHIAVLSVLEYGTGGLGSVCKVHCVNQKNICSSCAKCE